MKIFYEWHIVITGAGAVGKFQADLHATLIVVAFVFNGLQSIVT